MLGLLCLAKGALAATPAIHQQLEIAAKQALLPQEKAGDKPPAAQLSFIPPREADRLPICPTMLQIRGIDTRNPGRMRFAVSCPDLWQNVWTVRARLLAPSPQTPEIEAESGKIQKGIHREEVATQDSKKDAGIEPPHSSISSSSGNGRVLIRRGDKVDIIASRPGIEVRVSAEAQNHGKAGDIIRVRNLASGRIFPARVSAAGVVSPLE